MEIDNYRKDKLFEAKTEDLGQSPIQPLNSVMISNTEDRNAPLPEEHIATITAIVDDESIQRATKAIISNKGAPGIDGITTDEIRTTMKVLWPKIKVQILTGEYFPSPVKRVEIPKPDGKETRKLGIPTVMDRIIQQAIHQELAKVFEPLFSNNSYGFRPNRSAHQAVSKAQEYIETGCEWVVDIDLEKFFDTMNHDLLMARIAKKVKDKEILRLIRRYLQSGIMENGLVKPTEEGAPQGGPLSPLLSNIMLDDLDKELENRGLRFARYADDCNIYVKSEKAGHRVMESITKYLSQELKLKVNQGKSAVDNPRNRKFLGFTFVRGQNKPYMLAVHDSRIKRFKDKIRGLSKEMRGNEIKKFIKKRIVPITRGWVNYFGIAEMKEVFKLLDGWIRRKIRCAIWRQWKTPRTRYKRLKELGIKDRSARNAAYNHRGPWRMARTHSTHRALSNRMIESMGYVTMEGIAARL